VHGVDLGWQAEEVEMHSAAVKRLSAHLADTLANEEVIQQPTAEGQAGLKAVRFTRVRLKREADSVHVMTQLKERGSAKL